MTTKIVHCKKDIYDVYGGRAEVGVAIPDIGRNGWLGNPFRIGEVVNIVSVLFKMDRELSLILYKKYFYMKMDAEPEFKEAIEALEGKTLACWCVKFPIWQVRSNKACHLEIILEYLEALK